MTLEARITNLEQRTAAQRQRRDPLRMLTWAAQLAMMTASVPAVEPRERQRQLARVDRLRRACETGSASGVEADLAAFGFQQNALT